MSKLCPFLVENFEIVQGVTQEKVEKMAAECKCIEDSCTWYFKNLDIHKCSLFTEKMYNTLLDGSEDFSIKMRSIAEVFRDE